MTLIGSMKTGLVLLLLCPALVLASDRESFGDAEVYVDGQSLQELHLTAGTARPYAGGKREGWCGDNGKTW